MASIDKICIFLQLLLITFTILLISFKSMLLLIVFITVYVCFIVSELFSSWFKFILNKKTYPSLKSIIEKYIKSRPEITFHAECYHFISYKKNMRKIVKKYIKYTDFYDLPILSYRDVSGVFMIKPTKFKLFPKKYIKLDIQTEIGFSDNISCIDYTKTRSNFWRSNRFRDYFMKFHETRDVIDIDKNVIAYIDDDKPINCYNNLDNINNNDINNNNINNNRDNNLYIRNSKYDNFCEKIFINIWAFLVMTIIPLTEFYKLILNNFCIEKKFTIRKLVSTRYDLKDRNYEKYDILAPKLNIFGNTIQFEKDKYVFLNKNICVNEVKEDELICSKSFSNLIPKYIQNSFGEIINKYTYDYNNDMPPKQFTNLNGNIPLTSRQLISQGNLDITLDKEDNKNINEREYNKSDNMSISNNENYYSNNNINSINYNNIGIDIVSNNNNYYKDFNNKSKNDNNQYINLNIKDLNNEKDNNNINIHFNYYINNNINKQDNINIEQLNNYILNSRNNIKNLTNIGLINAESFLIKNPSYALNKDMNKDYNINDNNNISDNIQNIYEINESDRKNMISTRTTKDNNNNDNKDNNNFITPKRIYIQKSVTHNTNDKKSYIKKRDDFKINNVNILKNKTKKQ